MLTVDVARLGLRPGDRVLDLGCGAGRHAFEFYRRGAQVVALDRNAADVTGVGEMFAAMREAGEAPAEAAAVAIVGDAFALPFPDAAFDVVVISEVLEHIADDRAVIAELDRVLRPGGTLAVTVPRWWPERVCWALSDAYHQVEGGHIRIYRQGQLLARLRERSFIPRGTHHAHALHSPYWWLKCLFGPDNDTALPVRLYHRLLVHDIMRGPWWTRRTEQLLNPLVGKSFVVYLAKPEADVTEVWLTDDAVAQTAQSIVEVQLPSGQIPWFPGGQTDPWDHIEAALALDTAARHAEARAAYEWLRTTQNPDGSWFRTYAGDDVLDRVREANFSAYLAVGLLHHVLGTGDEAFVSAMWPTLTAGIGFVLDLQAPGGQIRWARSEDGSAAEEALLTGSASMYHSLRCALELARRRGEPQPDWELAAATLGHAIVAHPERFAPRDRY